MQFLLATLLFSQLCEGDGRCVLRSALRMLRFLSCHVTLSRTGRVGSRVGTLACDLSIMADASKEQKLKLANSRKRFKELKKRKEAIQKQENVNEISKEATPVDSLTSSTHSSINNETPVEHTSVDNSSIPTSLPNYFDSVNYGDNSMFFDNLSKSEVKENNETSSNNIFNYFNSVPPNRMENMFSDDYSLFPQDSQHNYVTETQQILHPVQDALSLDDPEIKQNELFEIHRNSDSFSNDVQDNLTNYLQSGNEKKISGSEEKISETENTAIKNEIMCSSNTAQKEVRHSSAESLKQLSNQMAQLIEPDYAISNPITDLEKRNLELAALLEQEQLKTQQQKNQFEELQARITKLETDASQKDESFNIQTAAEISRLREELQCHIQTVGMLVAEKTELSASLSQLELISKQKNSECEELQARLKASRSRAFELEQELNAFRAEKSRRESSGTEQSSIIERLRQDYNSLQEQREELVQDLLEVREKLKNSSEDNLKLQKENQELSRKLSLAEVTIQQIRSGEQHLAEGQMEKLTQEKFELEKQLSNFNLMLKTITKERDESTSQYQQYTQELNAQLSNLSNQVQRLQQENENLSIQEQNRVKHIGELERQLQSLQNEQVSFAVNRPGAESDLKGELESTRELCIQLQKRPPNRNNKSSGGQKRKQNEAQASKQNESQASENKKQKKDVQPPRPAGIKMVIVHNDFPPKTLPEDQLDCMQTAILGEIDKIADGAFRPQFLKCFKRRGMLTIECNNQESVDWLNTTIETLVPWEGAKIKVIKNADIPVYKIIQVLLPNIKDEPEKVLKRLDRQNPGLKTKDWYVVNTKTEKNLQEVIVSVEQNVLEALEKVDYKPFLNFSRIEVRCLGKPRKAKLNQTNEPAKEQNADEVVKPVEGQNPKDPVEKEDTTDADGKKE
ncbi:hypothetical protein JTB14_027643 [Gonioctena quinquepunctata]|nr:hypothetical protein JTB14_027643 [Gonioctena quinquepunctata]